MTEKMKKTHLTIQNQPYGKISPAQTRTTTANVTSGKQKKKQRETNKGKVSASVCVCVCVCVGISGCVYLLWIFRGLLRKEAMPSGRHVRRERGGRWEWSDPVLCTWTNYGFVLCKSRAEGNEAGCRGGAFCLLCDLRLCLHCAC